MRVIATAGHVDHGKSTLVRALTGPDPDRWAEAHRRGLTIDLGSVWTSIPMQDGGIQAHAIMQRLRERYLCTEHLRAEPKNPLPSLDIPSNVIAEMPPLLKAYMRLGAKICGEPCWDEDFQVADVFILLKRDELCPRYAKHFKAAV